MKRSLLALLLACSFVMPLMAQTITYASFRYEDEAIYKALIDKFQKENPKITVKWDTNQDTNAYYTALKANLQSGQGPDVFDVHPNTNFVAFAVDGVLADLSKLAFVKNYQEGPKAMTTIGGKVYGYNQDVNLICVIYNKDIFKKVGVAAPKNWADFVSITNKLKQAGYGGMAYIGGTVKAAWLTNAIFCQVMGPADYKALQEGIDSGKIMTIKDNAKAMTALKTLAAYYAEKIFYDNSDTLQYPQSLALFAQKKAAQMMMGTWTFGTKATDYPDVDQGIFPVPTLASTDIAYAEGGQVACVNAASKSIDAAKKFVDFLAAPENSSIYIAKSKMTPTVKGVKADFSGIDMLNAQMSKGVNVLPVAVTTNDTIWTPFWNAMAENILFKGADVNKEAAAFEAALVKSDLKNKK